MDRAAARGLEVAQRPGVIILLIAGQASTQVCFVEDPVTSGVAFAVSERCRFEQRYSIIEAFEGKVPAREIESEIRPPPVAGGRYRLE